MDEMVKIGTPRVGQKVSVDFGGLIAEGVVTETVDGILSVVVVINVDSRGSVQPAYGRE